MAARDIRAEWVERVLERPEFMLPDARQGQRLGAFRRIEEFGGRWLRVVFERSGDRDRVVTVFFDRNAGRRS